MSQINRAGFVAVIGAPNAGKSTLVNRLVGQKVAIVTHKVQTTRFPIRGITQIGDAQLVLMDTPGIFRAKKRLDRAMVHAAWSGAEDADVILHIIDASGWVATARGEATPAQKKSVEDDRRVVEGLEKAGKQAFLALNKIDLFAHEDVLPIIAELSGQGVYREIFPISASNGDGIAALSEALAGQMPEGPPLYPEDQPADLPLRLLAAEITREKLMLRVHEELPYQLSVETESWEAMRNGDVRVQQVVLVARETHKPIILGKGGQTIKQVGALAREELAELLGQKVHLFLFVKVDPRWMERRESYAGYGLEFDV